MSQPLRGETPRIFPSQPPVSIPRPNVSLSPYGQGSTSSQEHTLQQQQQQQQQQLSKASPPQQQSSNLPQVAPSMLKPGADSKAMSEFSLPSLSMPPQPGPAMGQAKPSGNSTPPSSAATSVHLPAIAPQTTSTSNPIPSFPSLPSKPLPNAQLPAGPPMDSSRFPGGSGGRLPFNNVNRPTGVPHVRDLGRPGMRPLGGNLPPGGRLPPGNFPHATRPPGELQRPPAVNLLPGPLPDGSGRLPPVSDFQFPPSAPVNQSGMSVDMRSPGDVHRPLSTSSFPQQSPGMAPPAAISPAGAPRRPIAPPSMGGLPPRPLPDVGRSVQFPGLPPGQGRLPGAPLLPPRGPPPPGPPRQRVPGLPPGPPVPPILGESGPIRGPPLDVWFEYLSPEGRSYYSNPKTQKTTWERPMNARIIPPDSASSPVTSKGPEPVPFLPPPGPLPPNFPQPGGPGGLPGASQLVPTRVWSEHAPQGGGRPYYYNKVTKQSVWEKPKDFELVMPLPANFGLIPVPASTTASASGGLNSVSASAPVGTPVQNSNVTSSSADAITTPTSQEVTSKPVEEEEVSAEGKQDAVEVSSSSQDREAMEAVDSEPSESAEQQRQEEVAGQADAQNSSSNAGTDQTSEIPPPPHQQETVVPLQPPIPINMAQFGPGPPMMPPAVMPILMPPSALPSSALPLAVPGVHPGGGILPKPDLVKTEPEKVEMKAEPTGPRPVASIPVPGTPWSVVWSSDDRTFFFNATSHTSLWTTPDELLGNSNLQKILDNPPGGKSTTAPGPPKAKRIKLNNESGDDEDSDSEDMEVEGGASGETAKPNSATAEQVAAEARATKPLEERQQDFKSMLLERGVSAFSTWDKELPKFVFDPRYLLLNVKERKACFETFIRSRTEEERREKKNKLKETRDQFKQLLEAAKLHAKSSFSEFAAKYSKDDRFKAVERMREREQLFNEYLVELKKSAAKQKEEQKSTTKTKIEKEKLDFMSMLGESEAITERSQWKKIKGLFSSDPRYKAVDSTKREDFFDEHVRTLAEKDVDREKERRERIEASLKERERQVEMSRTAHEREWDRERDQLRKAEATQQFKALLVDIVRSAQLQWHEAKKLMKKDHRWELTKPLGHDEKEQYFQDHVLQLREKKRLQFRKLLSDTSEISLNMQWRKARKLIKDDPRYKNFTDSDHKREVEYDKFQRDKLLTAKTDFRVLLHETKILTYKSRDLVRESDRHYRDIIDILRNDRRYLVLDCIPREREDLLYSYIDELHRKGPPPPPTATHPRDRLKH